MPDQIRFIRADRSHDEGIRSLLRESAMDGEVSLSLQTEPSYFDAVAIEGEHHAVVAVDGARVVCVGGVSVRTRYLNGLPARVGYLGRLRLAASHAGRFDLLVRGYTVFRELHESLNLNSSFTSVATDNTRARQFFERGVRGMPVYRPAGELVTLVVRTKQIAAFTSSASLSDRRRLRAEGMRIADSADPRADAVALGNRLLPQFQFAPLWTRDDLDAPRAPAARDYRFLTAQGVAVGVAAFWDQRSFKQTVIAYYAARVRRLRWLHNARVTCFGRGVPLPPVRTSLSQGFLSHLALPPDRADWLVMLVRSVATVARLAKANLLAIGLDARDPRLPSLVRCFRPFVYRTRLYSVNWPDAPPGVVPDGRLIYPEISLL